MNILVIDCALSRLSIAVKAEDKMISEVFDIGMKQSEILVPVIQEVLQKIGLETKDLDYSALTIGPGSFTGLRLGISALKAIELAYNVPVYGISSLKVYGYPYTNLSIPVLSCIDANKDKFYATITQDDKVLLAEGDWKIEKLIEESKKYKELFIAGPDADKLKAIIEESNKDIKIYISKARSLTTDSLISITEELIANKAEPLQDFDGPVYLRASEAEIKLQADQNK